MLLRITSRKNHKCCNKNGGDETLEGGRERERETGGEIEFLCYIYCDSHPVALTEGRSHGSHPIVSTERQSCVA